MQPHGVIGVTGKKRHGKDEVARHLVENWGFTRMALADELKQMVLDLDPLVVVPDSHTVGTDLHASEVYRLSVLVERFGMEAAKEVPEVRRLLQVFGTEVIRNRDEDFWLRVMLNKVERGPVNIVIPDVRFDNEAEFVHQLGGIVVQVTRPGLDDGDAHASEAGVSPALIDYSVTNDGTLAALHTKLHGLWPR